MSKQTAVEWLYFQLIERINPHGDTGQLWETLQKAKAMEKEQMIDIGSHCFARGHKGFQPIESDAEPTAEEYYYETYRRDEK